MLPRHVAAIVVLARGDAELASWPLEGRGLDLAVVDEVARLHLAARRMGCSIRLRHACAELSALLAFVGLADVVTGVDRPPRLQVVGQPEGGEEGGVEEVVVADDPVA
jgi:hypothetical protein